MKRNTLMWTMLVVIANQVIRYCFLMFVALSDFMVIINPKKNHFEKPQTPEPDGQSYIAPDIQAYTHSNLL